MSVVTQIWMIHICVTFVWQYSFICVTWLILVQLPVILTYSCVCDITHPHMWYDYSYKSHVCVCVCVCVCERERDRERACACVCAIHTRDMCVCVRERERGRGRERRRERVRVRVCVCDVIIHACIQWLFMEHMHICNDYSRNIYISTVNNHIHTYRYGLSTRVIWCDYSCMHRRDPRLIHTCDAIHLYVWLNIFIRVTWYIHVWFDIFICVTSIRVTWLIHMCDMTHSYVWHDSFICVTW